MNHNDDELFGIYCEDGNGGDYYNDFTFDVDASSRKVALILRHMTLKNVIMALMSPAAAIACIGALFGQIKNAKSIKEFRIYLFPSNQVPMFDLRQFVESNQSLQELWNSLC
jgi:hypothetical protein